MLHGWHGTRRRRRDATRKNGARPVRTSRLIPLPPSPAPPPIPPSYMNRLTSGPDDPCPGPPTLWPQSIPRQPYTPPPSTPSPPSPSPYALAPLSLPLYLRPYLVLCMRTRRRHAITHCCVCVTFTFCYEGPLPGHCALLPLAATLASTRQELQVICLNNSAYISISFFSCY